MKRIIAVCTAFVMIFALSACSDITKSKNYETHSLKYLVNLTNYQGDTTEILNELKSALEARLNKFQIDEYSFEQTEEEGLNYITLNFGTIDNIEDIKKKLNEETHFSIKLKIADESDYENNIKEKAKTILESIKNDGENFQITAQNAVFDDPERVFYSSANWMYKDEIKNAFAEVIDEIEPGNLYPEIVEYTERPFALAAPINIVSIIKLFDRKDVERTNEIPKKVEVNHILIAYQGGLRANEDLTRTKEEAETLATEILDKLKNGEDFGGLALEYSDDGSNSASGGYLEVAAGEGVYAEAFEKAALELNEAEDLSDIIETPFGYHIIKARKVTEAETEAFDDVQAKFGVIFFAQKPQEWEYTDIKSQYVDNVETLYTKEYDPYLIIHLNDEGREKLKILTEKTGDVLGVFVGNELITSFTVKEINENGYIKIMSPASTSEADTLFQKFTTKPLPVPIIFID